MTGAVSQALHLQSASFASRLNALEKQQVRSLCSVSTREIEHWSFKRTTNLRDVTLTTLSGFMLFPSKLEEVLSINSVTGTTCP